MGVVARIGDVAADVDAIVDLSAGELEENPGAATRVSADPDVFGQLVGMLDLEVGGFYMHTW